jgi:4-oxalmesaconate hydratase
MIIDCHGHYTTAPRALIDYRERQIKNLALKPDFTVSDDEIRETIETNQLAIQKKRGVDLTLFSPRAAGMAHHIGTEQTSRHWTQACNDMIHRVCALFPQSYAAVCQLPQSPGADLKGCVAELSRCVEQLGFVGCNLNPDPSDGHWTSPPLTDRYWYPLYEKMVELDVPAMVHVSMSCNPAFHAAGAHYINGDTTAFMQLIQGDLFKDFPTLRLVIPHGGGAVPYHWGRYRGIAQDMKKPPLTEHLLKNVFFDTCVYHQPGIDLLLQVIPPQNILFASEIVGAVQSIDPETGHYFDDTRRYIDQSKIPDSQKVKIFESNARRVYPRLAKRKGAVQ